MCKKIKLLNFLGQLLEFEIKDIEDVLVIFVQVLSGDEVAHVIYNSGEIFELDSGMYLDRDSDPTIDTEFTLFTNELDKFNNLNCGRYDRRNEVEKWRENNGSVGD